MQEEHVPTFKKKLKSEGEEGDASGPNTAAAGEEAALPDPSAANNGTVFVNDLAPECTEKELRGSFKRFGFLDSIHINYDKQCGYVTFLSSVSAVRAVNEMKDSLFCGRKIMVSAAQGAVPPGALCVWKKNDFSRHAQRGQDQLTDLNGESRQGEEKRPNRSWGDEMGAPAEGEEAAAAVGACRGLAAYDDDEILDF